MTDDGQETRLVTLREMVEHLSYLGDDETFRWYQTSRVAPDGSIRAGETLRVTMRQARLELRIDDGINPPLRR